MLTSTLYYEAIQLIERLHRRSLDVIKLELDKRNIQDINNVQCMILYNVGDEEMTVGELTIRGYYLGSNVSYNVKKMVENGYLLQERSVHDKRSIRVKVSEKGKKLCGMISEMFDKHVEKLGASDINSEKIAATTVTLKNLERFWASLSNFSGMPLDDDF